MSSILGQRLEVVVGGEVASVPDAYAECLWLWVNGNSEFTHLANRAGRHTTDHKAYAATQNNGEEDR